MKVVLSSLILIVLMVGVLVGCAKPIPSTVPTPTPAPTPTKILDIGIATPLTGPGAHLGTYIQNAVLLAIDDQNKQGGVTIAGEKYMLNAIIRDTKFDVIVGKSVAEELVFDKGVKIIFGPFIGDAVGAQIVTEKNKVLLFPVLATKAMIGPSRLYSFYPVGFILGNIVQGAEYIRKFYPEAKRDITVTTDLPGLEEWFEAMEMACREFGFDWLGYEKFPAETKDFMPLISRVLAKKPDIVDTGRAGGEMGAACCVLIKQLREAGFDGLIWCPTVPEPSVMMEVVPKQYRTCIVTNDIMVDSPIVPQAYKDMVDRYIKKFGVPPIDIVGEFYSVAKALFEFLNTQDSMDTTVWVEGFAKYSWQSQWGQETFWFGESLYGNNRVTLRPFFVSEWTDGNLETKWEAPIPWEFFGVQK